MANILIGMECIQKYALTVIVHVVFTDFLSINTNCNSTL